MNGNVSQKPIVTPTRLAWTRTIAAVALAGICLRASAQGPATAAATAARPATTPTAASALDTQCRTCHRCDKPTPAAPCLKRCTRSEAQAEEFRHKHGPDVVILNELQDHYLPVPFDHKGHAGMAGMTRSCAVCHHYTPTGASHPACKTCHEVSPARADIHKPSLKGAYHRQCLSCHREWSHQSKCTVCHLPKSGRGARNKGEPAPTEDDILGRMHPPIPEPDTEVYQTRSKPAPGTEVIFRHREHIHRFGLKCVNCHREESCSRCHEAGRKRQQNPPTLAEHHQPCSRCHAVNDKNACRRCHWKQGRPKPKPFDHADTGWPLNKYHLKLSCRACHKTVPFRKLKRDCNGCHAGWQPEKFDHAVTGQILDDNHSGQDCENCHVDRNFAVAPTCDACHEEDEGIAFPAKRPGPRRDSTRSGSPPESARPSR